MPKTLSSKAVFASIFLCAAPSLAAGAGAVYDGSSFVGLPVFARDGVEVGEVVSETKGTDGQPVTIRVAAGQALGIGEKLVDIERDKWIGLRGAVTLEHFSHEVEQLAPAE